MNKLEKRKLLVDRQKIRGWIIVFGVSAFTLYLIGLYPYRELSSGSDVGLAGVFLLMFSWVSWLLGFVVSIIVCALIYKVFPNVIKQPMRQTVLLSLVINLVGAFPASLHVNNLRNVYIKHEKYVQDVINPTTRLVGLKIDEKGACHYTVEIFNNSDKNFDNVSVNQSIAFYDDAETVFRICNENNHRMVFLKKGVNVVSGISEPSLYNSRKDILSLDKMDLRLRSYVSIENVPVVSETILGDEYRRDILSKIRIWAQRE